MKKTLLSALAGFIVLAGNTHAETLTQETAPDIVGKAVLGQALAKLDQGAPAGVDPSPTIHRNFTQIIDQNFASLNPSEAAKRVDGLSEAELSDLAQLYINAAADNGKPARLFNVLAHRLDPRRLERISRHFGFAATYAAISASSPEKIQAFLTLANPNHLGPTPGEMRFGPYGRYAAGQRAASRREPDRGIPALRQASYAASFASAPRFIKTAGGFGQFMNYTPYEIYLSFRTAPVGALAVEGALYETTVVLSSTLASAYGTGYAIGTYIINPLINNYAPSLGNTIGAGVAAVVDTLTNSWSGGTATAGQAQQSAAIFFMVTPAQYTSFSTTSGDFGVTSDFTSYVSGGGSCFVRSGNCPPVELH